MTAPLRLSSPAPSGESGSAGVRPERPTDGCTPAGPAPAQRHLPRLLQAIRLRAAGYPSLLVEARICVRLDDHLAVANADAHLAPGGHDAEPGDLGVGEGRQRGRLAVAPLAPLGRRPRLLEKLPNPDRIEAPLKPSTAATDRR